MGITDGGECEEKNLMLKNIDIFILYTLLQLLFVIHSIRQSFHFSSDILRRRRSTFKDLRRVTRVGHCMQGDSAVMLLYQCYFFCEIPSIDVAHHTKPHGVWVV